MSKEELNFEKNYDHLEVEKRIVRNWEDNKIFYGINLNNKKLCCQYQKLLLQVLFFSQLFL